MQVREARGSEARRERCELSNERKKKHKRMKKQNKTANTADSERRRVQDRFLLHRRHMKRGREEKRGPMRGGGRGGGERWRSQSERTGVFLYLQYLQIAQRSESSIFDAADVVAVQLPAPCTQTHTHTHRRTDKHTHTHR